MAFVEAAAIDQQPKIIGSVPGIRPPQTDIDRPDVLESVRPADREWYVLRAGLCNRFFNFDAIGRDCRLSGWNWSDKWLTESSLRSRQAGLQQQGVIPLAQQKEHA